MDTLERFGSRTELVSAMAISLRECYETQARDPIACFQILADELGLNDAEKAQIFPISHIVELASDADIGEMIDTLLDAMYG